MKKIDRRNFLNSAVVAGATLPLASLANDFNPNKQYSPKNENPTLSLNSGLESGVMVSTHPERGNFRTSDFNSDVEAVQSAYDYMVTKPDMPRTLILDASARPFEFDGFLDIWQSKCRITSTGGATIVPKQGYKGPVIQSTIRDETEVGEDGLISDVIMDNIWIDGKEECVGIKLRHLQESTIHDIHVRSTDGPGLWISDCVIENMFSNIILSDNCGNDEYPAMLIEPENIEITQEKKIGNLSINSTQFSGVLIHFPTNDALRISCGGHIQNMGRRQRKIQFVGCMFHGHSRQTKPLVSISEAQEISIVGTQMITGEKDGVVILQMGKDGGLPVGNTLISHCFFYNFGSKNAIGISVENVDEHAPFLAAFGNSFGIRNGETGWLKHAVNWGSQKNKMASWQGNLVGTNEEPHVGVMPSNADILPF